MEKTIKNNIIWIDYAKFIGIFLMIFQHNIGQVYHLGNNFIFNSIGAFILLFHMPLFFVISGYLYHSKSKKENYKKIFWSLLLPYIIYQVLYLPFVLINKILICHLDAIFVIKKCLLGICFGETVNNPLYFSVCGPCWFILSMLSIRIIVNNFELNLKSACCLAFISFILLNIFIYGNVQYSYFCIAPTLLAIPYFVFGYILQKKSKIISFLGCESTTKTILNTLLIVFLVIYLTFVLLYTGHTLRMPAILELRPTMPYLLMYYFAGVGGTVAIFILSKLFRTLPEFIDIISKNTLFIIFFHFVLLAFAKFYNFSRFVEGQNPFTILIILTLSATINLFICYCVIKFLQKYCPLLLGKYRPVAKENQ